MKKVMQLFSSTVVVSTLILGTSAAYITTSNANAQAAEQVQKWGYGEGGASSESGTNLKAETPWYNYEGCLLYTSPSPRDS